MQMAKKISDTEWHVRMPGPISKGRIKAYVDNPLFSHVTFEIDPAGKHEGKHLYKVVASESLPDGIDIVVEAAFEFDMNAHFTDFPEKDATYANIVRVVQLGHDTMIEFGTLPPGVDFDRIKGKVQPSPRVVVPTGVAVEMAKKVLIPLGFKLTEPERRERSEKK